MAAKPFAFTAGGAELCVKEALAIVAKSSSL